MGFSAHKGAHCSHTQAHECALDREEVVLPETQKQSDKCPAMDLVQQLTATLSSIPGNFAHVRALPSGSSLASARERRHPAALEMGTLVTGANTLDTAET